MDQISDHTAATPAELNRREFLKLTGGGVLTLGATQLSGTLVPGFISEVLADSHSVSYNNPEDVYQKMWAWDKITFGSHTNACLPSSCGFHVYVKDGMVWREEQIAHSRSASPDYPDFNPLGCQKGCSFHKNLTGDDRILYPLKRVGERGEGKWERISWDEALDEVAEATVEAITRQGTTDAYVMDAPHFHCGAVGWVGASRFTAMLGGLTPDLNVEIGDFYKGAFDTIGKMHTGYSADNLFDAELIFLTHSNWSYTGVPLYHFITEARYNGTEVVMVAPDYNPTTIAADIHVPVKVGGDPALWLGICHVMVNEKLYDVEFVKTQTDMPLLVRTDNQRFLRAPDLTGEGREDQLYFYDLNSKAVVPAPRGTLTFEGDQALEGSWEVTLHSGEKITVTTVFENTRERLKDYTPELAAEQSGAPANLIAELGRKVAKKRTASYIGFSSAKTYHGDLFERSLLLAMGLSGNWGKPGTGWNGWALPADHMELLMVLEKPFLEGGAASVAALEHQISEQVRAADPDVTDEIISVEVVTQLTRMMGVAPPVFWLYYHCGFKELYDTKAWQDPAMKKSFGEYMEEAIEKGWWSKELVRPAPDSNPDVINFISGNPIRRVRGGGVKYPEVLFPKAKMLWAVEARMSATALYCDIVLPAAWYYEKEDFPFNITQSPQFQIIEKAVNPPGECREEWQIYGELAKRVDAAAARKGLTHYTDALGQQRQWNLWDRYSMNGHLQTNEDVMKEMCIIMEATEMVPPGFGYEQFKKQGFVRMTGFGKGFMKDLVANEFEADKPFYSLRWHVDDDKVYPTYSRRAQFYIDHDWYLDANEHLPIHKDTPQIGGDHRFQITGGHPRHSIHSTHQSQPTLMKLHRGQPVIHINDRNALEMGISDGDEIRVWNDFSDFEIMARISPSVQPNQVIVYMWEGYQFKNWKVYDRLLIGVPKALHFAGGYGQLRYYFYNGSPAPSTDRGVRVSIEKI